MTMRLIDADKVPPLSDLSGCGYEGSEYQAYKSGAEYGRGLVDDAPTIDPRFLRPMEEWIRVKDRPPEDHVAVFAYDSVCRNIYKAWFSYDLGEWFSEEYLPDFVNITHWLPLPQPPKETHND